MAGYFNYGVNAGITDPNISTNANANAQISKRNDPNWGSTFAGDLLKKPNFANYVRELMFGACTFVRSGIIQRNATLDMSSGGTRITVPFVRPFLASEEIIKSDTTWGESGKGHLSIQKINADSQVCAVMHRGWAFGADDLSSMESGIDTMGAIASYIADNSVRHRHATLREMLDGILTRLHWSVDRESGKTWEATSGQAVSPDTHIMDVSNVTDGVRASEANFLSAANVIAAGNIIGENQRTLRTIAMHSNVYNYLRTVGMLTFSTSALSTGGNVAWGGGGVGVGPGFDGVAQFAGYDVVVDDKLTPDADAEHGDKYPVYIFGPGAVQLGIQQDFRIAYDRQILSFQDVAAVDYHELLHVDGVSYDSAADNPDNARLRDGMTWKVKYDHRFIPIIKLVVNTPFATNVGGGSKSQ